MKHPAVINANTNQGDALHVSSAMQVRVLAHKSILLYNMHLQF